jgi:hypothetical protein
MRCATADHQTQSNDRIVIARQLRTDDRKLEGARDAHHGGLGNSRFLRCGAGTGEQRFGEFFVPARGDDRQA